MILRFRKRVQKGLFRILYFNCGVYAYILSMVRDRLRAENTSHFSGTYTGRRWTAIGMGADRDHTAIGALAIVNNLIPKLFFYIRAIFIQTRKGDLTIASN